MQVLTVLPKSCSIRTVDREFRASNSIARTPQRLVEDKGILCIPTPQFGTILSDITVDMLHNSVTVTGLVGFCQVSIEERGLLGRK